MNFCNLIIALLLLEASKNKVNLLVNVIALFVVTCKSYQNSKPDRQGIKNLCCGIRIQTLMKQERRNITFKFISFDNF